MVWISSSPPPSLQPIPSVPSFTIPRPTFLLLIQPITSFQTRRNPRTTFLGFAGTNGGDGGDLKKNDAGAKNGSGGGEAEDGGDPKNGRRPIFNLKLGDLLDPDPDNVVAVGLTCVLTWASVQVLSQLFFISFAILVAALKYSFIAALLIFILIALL